jgi:hypothetical protein
MYGSFYRRLLKRRLNVTECPIIRCFKLTRPLRLENMSYSYIRTFSLSGASLCVTLQNCIIVLQKVKYAYKVSTHFIRKLQSFYFPFHPTQTAYFTDERNIQTNCSTLQNARRALHSTVTTHAQAKRC